VTARGTRAALWAALAGLVLLLSELFPGAWPRGFIVQGLVFGCAAGLLALGLVLTYRTTRVINFSYGAMGSFAAEVGVFSFQEWGVPWPLAILVAIATGIASGVAVERLMRRFVGAPRLVVTVATIGLLQVFVGLQFMVPYFGGGPLVVPGFLTPFSDLHFSIGHTLFYGNDLLAVAVVPFVLAGLSWFLLGTEPGTAVRAIAENPERAMLLGIPIHRLSRLVWMIVGGVAAAVMVLNAPTNGLPVSPFVGAGGIFLPALAAAIVAKMESLPVAFASGVLLGVLQAVAFQNLHKAALGTVLFLVVILAALLLRRWDVSRAETASESAGSLAGTSRALPPAVARLPELVVGRWVLLTAIAAAALAAPVVLSPSRTHTVTGYLLLGIVVLSLVVLSGWTGTVSLGQAAIVGVGAVAGGDVIAKANGDLLFVVAAGAAGGAVCALVLGLPALRVKPLFVAVTSVAFAAAMDQYFLNPTNYPDLIPDAVGRPVLLKRFPLHSERATFYLCLAFLAVTALVVRSLRALRPGRVLIAGRDNAAAAAAMGVPVTRTRVVGMVIAGMIAGVAGALHAVVEQGVGFGSFPTQDSVLLFSMAVVGGLGSVSGALCGVAVTEALINGIGLVSDQARSLAPFATGALLLGVLLVLPGGVAEGLARLIAALVARRHGLRLEVGAAAGSLDLDLDPDTDTDTDPATAPDPHPHPAAADTATPSNLRRRQHGSVLPVSQEPGAVVRCRDLTASYGSLQVLFGVDLEVAEGEIVALLGTNGAGKSTVFKAITGLLTGTTGTVELDGRSIAGEEPFTVATRGLSMMPGGRGVFPTLTVAENLRLACWQIRKDKDRALAAREEVLDLFPILRDRPDQLAGNLSGGEQQQLSLAMAFVTKPKVLFIDELSLGLAPTIVGQLCDKVREIHASGTTVVVVEQSVNVALLLAERAVFLEKGRVRFEGPTRGLLDRPDLLRSVFIGDAPPPTRARRGRRAAAPERNDRGVELSCRGVVKRFGGITALDGVDLTITPGRIVGLVGHNGAGKTTLFDVISGFQPADGGVVTLGGHDLTGLPPHRRAALGLGRSFQEALLYPSLTVVETVVVALERHLANRDPVAAALSLPAALDADAAAFERAHELVELLGLTGFADTPNADLSTGTRRIVELACVLAQDPAVVLLDEPSAGVAQRETEALGPLLRRVQAETGCAICLIEHDMGLMTTLCDELVALELGRVIASGPPRQVLEDPLVVESYLGTDPAAIERSGRRSIDAPPGRPPRKRAAAASARPAG
jgi:ABC-type branched-subunit amino acid transport system ATPase component/ABC-type branched-subunit amino acid transport system permease subunit